MPNLKIKTKNICKKNKLSIFFLIQIFAIVFLAFAPKNKAQAFGSPLQGIFDFSKQKLNDAKDAINTDFDQQNAEEKSDDGENKKSPQPVEDPQKINEAAEFASQATGIRKDFLMGMLVVESNLGRNPGKCTYREVEQGAENANKNGNLSSKSWNTFQNRRDVIKNIANDLGYDYETLRVSCNPGSAYVGTGGAMGIPQFMPDTWLEYRGRISQIVGKDNPDPWDIQDGAVAMALKLSDVPGVKNHDRASERNAAKMYLSGTTQRQYDWYANQTQYWADNYQKLLG